MGDMIFWVKTNNYIAAVVEGKRNLDSFLREAVINLPNTYTVEVVNNFYPFYILETPRGFEAHTDRAGAVKLAIEYANKRIATTLYDVGKDFLGDPKNPGRDYMGALNHEHFGGDDAA